MTDPIRSIKKRIKKKKDFYNHLGTYVVISVFLLGLNLYTNPDYMWAFWPIAGWGIAVGIQAVQVLVDDKTSKWEQKAIRQELEDLGYDPQAYADEELDLESFAQPPKKEVLYRKDDLV